ncbi:mannose-6-phosphate isomerase [delta proteobacterium NaphS2]|nr:mannose-6-phosphate isomerase [delta proteobacterium NaphS2]
MHIAMLSPIAWRTPPRHYGPWENVASLITEGLVSRGHKVTLFATGDSETGGTLHAVCPRGYEEDRSLIPKVWECLHISELFDHAGLFDIIHNNFDFLPLTYAGLTTTPVVTTIHGFSSPGILPVYKKYNGKTFYVSISDADRSPDLDYIETIHHGIDIRQFDFRAESEGYLLFFGRFHHDKGAKEAIEIARACGRKLVMAGIIQDEDYFQKHVKPFIDDRQVIYAGSVGPEKRNDLLGKAAALLHPINFNEPFGLSVIESMACGTPVIAMNRGSMSELIQDGKNGFLISNTDEAIKAVARVKGIDRAFCRKTVEDNFTIDIMVEKYIAVYEQLLEKTNREDQRPWGFYEILSDSPNHKIKCINVYPGGRLSYQRHFRRSEHWYVISGKAVVTKNGEEIERGPGQAIDLPVGTWHRVRNPGSKNTVFIEVQTGDYFGEDDIERSEDDYNRV